MGGADSVCWFLRLAEAVREMERLKAQNEDKEQEVSSLTRRLEVVPMFSSHIIFHIESSPTEHKKVHTFLHSAHR